jgi:hypothetical protein
MVLGLLLGVIGLAIVALLPNLHERSERQADEERLNEQRAHAERERTSLRECPHCRQSMRRDASVCPHCHRSSPAWEECEGRWVSRSADGREWTLDEHGGRWLPLADDDAA